MWNLLRKVLLLAYICLDFAFKSASSDRSSHIICPRYDKVMLFHFPLTHIDLTLKINDLHIDRVHEFNFLGTIIHETLEWTRHIDKVANKISRTLGILNKLKHVLPIYTLKTMYSASIVPHFNYNILLWGFN